MSDAQIQLPSDGVGKKVQTFENLVGGATVHTQAVSVVDAAGLVAGLITRAYDALSLGYTGDDLTTVRYYQGGLAGTLVATLTLAYDAPGGKLVSVART